MGESGGEMERSVMLLGVEKEERKGWYAELTWCAETARPRLLNRGSVKRFVRWGAESTSVN